MGYDTPLISVVMITYNHEKYIAESIESVLKQTFEDFEFIIVNDGSNDGTDEVIRSFQDPRITYIYQDNQGPSAATNNGILVSRGKYIALMSGDDACYPQRLEIQYQYLNSFGKKIVFSWVDFVDDDSQPFRGEHFAQNYFNHPNRTRAEILNWFFMEGNYLCAVTALIEKDILLECGLFNLASIQLQDFDMWIRIVKKYDITVIEEKLVKYRIRANFNNLSSDPANSSRSTFERCQIYRNILNNVSIELFKSSFSNQIKRPEFQEGYEYELEKAFLYLGHISTLLQSIGVEKLFDLLQNEEILFIAKSKYSFSLPELYKLTKDTDITNSRKQSELERSQSELERSQSELERSQSELERSQSELELMQSQLQQTQMELELMQSQLEQTLEEREQVKAIIRAMESSKFWKLRNLWFQIKQPIELNLISRKMKTLSFKVLITLREEGLSGLVRKVKIKSGEFLNLRTKRLTPVPTISDVSATLAEPFPIILNTSSTPIVSIVIPVYNKYIYTFNCLNSLKDEITNSISFEVIVVDDCSTDETSVKLNDVTGVVVLRNEINLGFIRSCNYGASKAKGKFLYFLNNDTQVLPGWLENLVSTIEEDGSVGAVGSMLLYPDGRLQEAGGIIWQDATGWNYGRFDDPGKPEYNYKRNVDYCSGASLLIREEVFRKVGGFSEDFVPAYYEDVDICFTLRKLGYQVIYEPRSKIVHFEGISSGTSITSGTKRYQEINRLKFIKKWQVELRKHCTPSDKNVLIGARRLQNKPTVLIVDSYVPLYDREAGSCRLLSIIKILQELSYSIIFLPDNGKPEEPYTSELQASGIEVIYSTPQQSNLQHQLIERLYLIDIAWVCRPDLCDKYLGILRKNPRTKVIYDTVDLHFIRLKRQQELLFSNSQIHQETWRNMKELELSLAKNVDATIVVTEKEKKILNDLEVTKVWVIPTIHSLPSMISTNLDFETRKDLLFIGSYNHHPNVDAVVWLCQEIMPLVWKVLPDIKVTLLGSSPSYEVSSLKNKRIIVTGYIQDVDCFFRESRVFVAPLRFGAGIKGKIGQSLSHALPVVTTSIGAEGIGLTHNCNVLIADTPEDFANCIVKLYTDLTLWNQIANNSLTAIKQYCPEVVKSNLVKLFESILYE